MPLPRPSFLYPPPFTDLLPLTSFLCPAAPPSPHRTSAPLAARLAADRSRGSGQGKKEGKGIFRDADGAVKAGLFKAGADVGEGVRWLAGGQEARRLRDGKPVEEISLEEARRAVARLGLPLPAEFAEAAATAQSA